MEGNRQHDDPQKRIIELVTNDMNLCGKCKAHQGRPSLTQLTIFEFNRKCHIPTNNNLENLHLVTRTIQNPLRDENSKKMTNGLNTASTLKKETRSFEARRRPPVPQRAWIDVAYYKLDGIDLDTGCVTRHAAFANKTVGN